MWVIYIHRCLNVSVDLNFLFSHFSVGLFFMIDQRDGITRCNHDVGSICYIMCNAYSMTWWKFDIAITGGDHSGIDVSYAFGILTRHDYL